MNSFRFLPLLACLAAATTALADPQLTSWFTANSGQYARIYQTTAAQTSGSTSTTWSRGQGTQSSPVYADINEIKVSGSWVYIRSSGLASHIMGPWYLNAAKTNLFPNYPSNTSVLYRIPRTPTFSTSKTLTGLGATGRMVNGVSMFDSRDAFSYSNLNATDATPTNGITGDGIWNRDAYHNEAVTFDPAFAHQAANNYHYHAQPIGLRYQLGDHVDYNSATNTYTESSGTVSAHSPILAWASDGLPVYGPYGYSSPMSATSGVRRMISGFNKRDGTNGTTAITVRQILPLWAQRIQGKTTLTGTQYGPAISSTYLLGHYIEDFDYLGDLGKTLGTDFDLNEQNVRFCVTPEFPSGTWAYFTPINSDGSPAFPYTTGRQFYGNTTGGATDATTMNADTPLTTQFLGGANTTLAIKSANVSNGTVTLTWSAVEGGTYSVDASTNQSSWTSKATGLVSTGTVKSSSYTALSSSGTEYGRVNRTALATYDSAGQTAATVSQSATTSYLTGTPVVAPTVTTPTSASITSNSAILGGNVTSSGGATITVRGVVFAATATNSNPQIGGTGVTNLTTTGTTGVFTVSASSLAQGTAYTFAAYATNSVGTGYSAAGSFTVSRNNILLIIADDYGLDASSLYNTSSGAQIAPTPNIASLAANGIQFNHAYTYGVCSPSRAAILTGRYGFRTGVGNVVAAASANYLQATEFTLPDAFAANSGLGYQLKHIGKWHLTSTTGATANLGPCTIGGWPAFAGSLAGQISDYMSWPKVTSNGTFAGTTSTTSTTYATTDQVNDAVSFITTQTTAGKPWFATVAFNAPHTPFHLPSPTTLCPHYASLSGAASDISANPLNYYNAAVEAMDTEIGRLLTSVDLTKTTVIFVGDNGTPSNVLQTPYPAQHGKDTLYEGGIAVPLIIRGPDVVSPGRTTNVLTHFVDLYSTILELAGINVSSSLPAGVTVDSQSLLPVIKNQSVTRSLAYSESFDIASPTTGGRSLRDSQYKLIRNQNGTDEFYDLSADPYENTNLFANGLAAMTSGRQSAYNTLVSQLNSYNTAPTISAVANRSTAPGTATGAIALTIGDGEMAPSILTVTATSSNTTLVPIANLALSGSGASRSLNVTPATGQSGTTSITVNVTDGGFTTASSFVLTVAVAPTVTTPLSSSITATAATLGGNVTSDGGATITARGVVFSPTAANGNPQIGGTGVTAVLGAGTTEVFNVNATGLSAGTAYTFAAYATNGAGTSYSSLGSFTTLSNNANLSNLVVNTATLSPAFNSGTTSYTASVANGIGSVTLTPTPAQPNASIKVNSVAVASGSTTGAVSLGIGTNLLTTIVTAQDGTTKSYTVTVTRQASITNWRQSWYGTTSNSGNSADDADPFYTDVRNLAVFAFFGPYQNPATARFADLPQPQMTADSLSYDFTERADVGGLAYGAEYSINLTDWFPVVDSGSGTRHIFSVPINGDAKKFLRLNLTPL